ISNSGISPQQKSSNIAPLSLPITNQQSPNIPMDSKRKRPANAFLLYNREMRSKVLEKNPGMDVGNISKAIGKGWHSLTDAEKEAYLLRARELKKEFHETHPDFVYTRRSKAELIAAGHHSYAKKRQITESDDGYEADDQSNSNNNNTNENTKPQKDPRGRKKKRVLHPKAPKHPSSAFLFYTSAVRRQVAEAHPGSTVGPLSKIMAGKWKALTDAEREPFQKLANDDKARYAREMEEYLQQPKDS
ncbi:8035_t:CDS:2, partial [Entrophospora sp. SA101]